MKKYYLRYESDGTTYNDNKLPGYILDKVTYELDDIIEHFSISYNDVFVEGNTVTVDGCYEMYHGDFPVDEEELCDDDTECEEYKFSFTLEDDE